MPNPFNRHRRWLLLLEKIKDLVATPSSPSDRSN